MGRKRILALAFAVLTTSTILAPAAYATGHHRVVERHPEIRKAMKALQNARKALTDADRDFGGHRTQAVKDIDQALDECRQAIAYDKH